MRAKISNVDIAKKLDVQHTTVSRWRSGDRTPSLAQMLKISETMGWELIAQAMSWKIGQYHQDFEKFLVAAYGREDDDEQPAAEGTPA
jgi:transcriptional regulator with XRE-family HTH domain